MFNNYQSYLKSKNQLLSEGQNDAIKYLDERFYRESKYMSDDHVLELLLKNTCIKINCPNTKCSFDHLDPEKYCERRYNCNDSDCLKDHYFAIRNKQLCKNREKNNCKTDCLLKHMCDENTKCREPKCESHHTSRKGVICADNKKCTVNNCLLIHYCKTNDCNKSSCKNAHPKERKNLKCDKGAKCGIRYCEMMHVCLFPDRCNESTCKLKHDVGRNNILCKNCYDCKNKKCPLKHTDKIVIKKVKQVEKKKEENIFSLLK